MDPQFLKKWSKKNIRKRKLTLQNLFFFTRHITFVKWFYLGNLKVVECPDSAVWQMWPYREVEIRGAEITSSPARVFGNWRGSIRHWALLAIFANKELLQSLQMRQFVIFLEAEFRSTFRNIIALQNKTIRREISGNDWHFGFTPWSFRWQEKESDLRLITFLSFNQMKFFLVSYRFRAIRCTENNAIHIITMIIFSRFLYTCLQNTTLTLISMIVFILSSNCSFFSSSLKYFSSLSASA